MGVAALRVNEPVAIEVAAVYLDSPPRRSPVVEAAYERLAIESDRLYAAITAPGRPGSVRIRFSSCRMPYASAAELIASVRRDRLLELTAAAIDHDRRHPLLDGTVGGGFDRLRAVHDVLGHGCTGAGFDRHGEYATWRLQERFHSALARRALATELHAKHSVRWTTGESPDHEPILIPPQLLRRARELAARP
jgi:hypothetical protein